MPTTVDALRLRRVLGRDEWDVPSPFGPDGWAMVRRDGASCIVSAAELDGVVWLHASIAHPDHLPTYEDLARLHAAVWRGGWAYQVFAPPSEHVNIHEHALHLWGRADGRAALPEFAVAGSI